MKQPIDYRAGIYCRLSVEDGPDNESLSIRSQKQMLTDYVQHQGWQLTQVYIDDGYSGTNFERPAFQQLLRDIEAGSINLVLVKDLSRLGRNYILCGQYTEVYFPAKGVRFIAVNDQVDTLCTEPNEIAPFKNILNDMYARDISKKVRSALQTRMQRGEYLGHTDPYGYLRSPSDRSLAPDPETAGVVRQIFSLYTEGAGCQQIANTLNQAGLLCPSDRSRARLYQTAHGSLAGFQPLSHWGKSSVYNILHNELYLGHMVQGRKRVESYRSKKTVALPPEEWVRVEHTHPALVEPALFAAAQQAANCRSRQVQTREGQPPHLFSGLFFCGDCGRQMSFHQAKERPPVYLCGGYRQRGFASCSSHQIDYDSLCRVVLADLHRCLTVLPEEREQACNQLARTWQRQAAKQQRLAGQQRLQAEHRLLALDATLRQLYDDKLSGLLPEPVFCQLLASYEEEKQGLQQQALLQPPPPVYPSVKLAELLALQTQTDNLTPWLLHCLIDKITIWEAHSNQRLRPKTLQITYCFARPGN